MDALPTELVHLILDDLRHDSRSLANCSLVCKAWLPQSSMLLFSSSTPYVLGDPLAKVHNEERYLSSFSRTVDTSSRLATNLRSLNIVLYTHTVALTASIIARLPKLERLSLSCQYELYAAAPNSDTVPPCTGRHLAHLKVHQPRLDALSYFLCLFTSVGTLEINGCQPALRPWPQRVHQVQHLHVPRVLGSTLADIANMLEPSALEEIKLSLFPSTEPATPEQVKTLLQSAGQCVRTFELVFERCELAWEFFDDMSFFQACTSLESYILVTPHCENNLVLFRQCIPLLMTCLPPQTQHVRLALPCEALRLSAGWCERDEMPFVLYAVDWFAIGAALDHRQALRSLLVATHAESVSFKRHRDVQEAVAAELPSRLRSITAFE